MTVSFQRPLFRQPLFRRPLSILAFGCILFLGGLGTRAERKPRPISHKDLWLIPRVGAPEVSPDGSRAVVAVQRPSYKKDGSESHLWLIDVSGVRRTRQITFDVRPESHVTWSPDGKKIAFVAQRGGNDDPQQIYLLDLERGGEATRVTDLPTGARRPIFSPDGKRIVFVSDVPRNAKSFEDMERILEKEKERDDNVLVYEGFPIRNWNRWLTDRGPRLFVQTIGEDKVIDVLAGTKLLARPGFDGRRDIGSSELPVVWTPNGESLLFVASDNRDRFAHDFTHDDLWLVKASGGEPRRLTNRGRKKTRESWSDPKFSPDGKRFYAKRVARNKHVYNAARLVEFSWPAMKTQRVIELPEGRGVMDYVVTRGDSGIYMLGEDTGHVKLFHAASGRKSARPAFKMKVGVYTNLVAADRGAGLVLLSNYQSASEPVEVVRIDPGAGKHHHLTRFTAKATAGLDLPPLEHFRFKAKNGRNIHSFLARPAGFNPKRRYPLLVMIHGGPHQMFRDDFFLRWNYHLLASGNYVVLATNYTGSTGFGEEFARGIQGDPLRGPADEINQAADAAAGRYKFIDGTRRCAAGASYGGHLANWMQAATNRYRCLISHAGLVNLVTQWGTSDVVYHREANLGGPPWKIPKVWLDQNPLFKDGYWQTPVLVTAGKKDERVPLANILEYWTVLQRRRVESRLLVFPDEDHWIMSGPNSRRFYNEVADWLARWLLDEDD